jgi:transposase InsO family protein
MSWTTQFVPALCTHDLLGIIDGSDVCPSKFTVDAEGKPTSTINPDFLVWQKKDQFVLAWLNATLSEKVLSMVYGLSTAQQVWAHLAKRFTPISRTRITSLRRQLQTITQGSKNCMDYLLTAKSLADQLAAIGKGVDDEELTSYVIGGLNPSYHTFVTTFTYGNRDTAVPFEDFQTELLNYEQLLEAHQKPLQPDGGQFAFHLQRQKNPPFPKKYRSPQYGRHLPRNNQHQHYSSAPPSVPPKPPTNSQYRKPPALSSNPASSNRPPCQICGKISHQALDCYHRLDFAFQGRHPSAQLAAMAAYSPESHEVEQPWYLDNSANHHVTSELEKLSLQEPYQGPDSVQVGNGGGLQIAHTGSSLITTPSSQFYLSKILHCPKASANLLSIQQFCKDNHCYFILTSTHFTIKDMQTKEVLLQGPSEAGLYPIYLQQLQSNKVQSKVAFLYSAAFLSHFTAFLGVTATVETWHSRLGHPSSFALNKMIQQSLLPCTGSTKFNKICDSCQVSKSKKLPFPNSTRMSTQPLELIHSDVWTSPILSSSGCKFYVLFIDDFSRFTWLYPLRHKSDVLSYFVKFKNLVENLFSCSIKQLQTDNGGEYVSMAFKSFTDTHGILHRFTCPYTSEQNGISERKHRHITETGLTLLAQSHLPSIHWVDAFLTAVYLINRLPTPVLQHHSPYYKLLNKHPDYTCLKTFGCACYPLLRPYTPHKLAFRSTKCVFLGYSSSQKGYQCLDLTTNRVYVSRHVVFDESQFPASHPPASNAPAVESTSGVAISIPPGLITYLQRDFAVKDLGPLSYFLDIQATRQPHCNDPLFTKKRK